MSTTITEVKEKNPNWFTPENKRFFGDISYKILHGKISKKPYLVQHTYAWSDMFGQKKKAHYRLHTITDDLKIGDLLDEKFITLESVKYFLSNN